jgi:hypothetical protein
MIRIYMIRIYMIRIYMIRTRLLCTWLAAKGSRSFGGAEESNVAAAIPARIDSCQGPPFRRPTPEPHQESTISADRLCKNPSGGSSAHSGSPLAKREKGVGR